MSRSSPPPYLLGVPLLAAWLPLLLPLGEWSLSLPAVTLGLQGTIDMLRSAVVLARKARCKAIEAALIGTYQQVAAASSAGRLQAEEDAQQASLAAVEAAVGQCKAASDSYRRLLTWTAKEPATGGR